MSPKVRIRHYLNGGPRDCAGRLEMNDKGTWHLVVRANLDLETIRTTMPGQYQRFFTWRQIRQGDRVFLELAQRPTVDFLCAIEELVRYLSRTETAA